MLIYKYKLRYFAEFCFACPALMTFLNTLFRMAFYSPISALRFILHFFIVATSTNHQ